MKFDTLSNGRIVEKIPGQIAQVPVDERDVFKTEF
jgi:hypothetical protein